MVKQDMEDVYTVGMGYMTGQGRPLDQKKGIEYLRQAADAGFLPAVRDLGVAYLNGQGVPPDAEKAYGYLKKASDQLDPNAMYHLALMYENGAYVEKDIYEALRLMGYAAGMGFSAAAVEADRIEDKIDAMRKAKLDSRPILNLEISDADVEACCCIKMYNAVIAKLKEAGVTIEEDVDGIRVTCDHRTKAVDIKTMPYPGFPTDMQAQFMAMLAISEGTGLVTETVFENRFMHVDELKRMGANIRIDGRTSVVEGVERLTGCQVKATDLRAGAAMVLSGLVAEGETQVGYIHHIDRGYDNLVGKLVGLGADIKRVSF